MNSIYPLEDFRGAEWRGKKTIAKGMVMANGAISGWARSRRGRWSLSPTICIENPGRVLLATIYDLMRQK